MTERPEVLLPETDPAATRQPAERQRMTARDRTAVAVLLVSTFVVILNETIMGVALPVLIRDLGVTASVGQWLTAGFLLTMAVVIPVTGFLVRRVRTRVLYGAAMALFSAGTLLAAVAPGFPVLLAARVVQAGGTAIMLPLLMTTVMTVVPPARRGAVMGNISIVISVAPAIGPTVSGIVLAHLNWRFMFWTVLPIALVTLAIGVARLADVGENVPVPVDVLSVVLSAVGFGGLVYALSSVGQSAGRPLPASTWIAFVVGAAVLAAFLVRQLVLQRTDRALLDLRTFRSGTFSAATVLMMIMMATLFGVIVILPLYTQDVLGMSPLETGLLLLPGGLLMGLFGPVVGRLYDRLGARLLLIPGAVVTSASLWMTTLFGEGTSRWLVLGAHLVLSAGFAFVVTPLFTAGLGAVEPRLTAYGSAIFGTTQQLAGAAGVALLVSVLSRRAASVLGAGGTVTAATASGIHAALLLAAAGSLLAIAGAFAVRTPAQPGATAAGPAAH